MVAAFFLILGTGYVQASPERKTELSQASGDSITIIKRLNLSSLGKILADEGFRNKRSKSNKFIITNIGRGSVIAGLTGCRNKEKKLDCRGYYFKIYYSKIKGKEGRIKTAIDKWNRTKRFGKAYLDKDRDLAFDWYFDLRGGVLREHIKRQIQFMDSIFSSFKTFVQKEIK